MNPKSRFAAVISIAATVAAVGVVASLNRPGPGPGTGATGAGAQVGTVWVADEYGNSITVIDVATNKPVTTLTGIEGPHNLQVAPDGKSVWVVSGHESMAAMIDAATYTLHGAVSTGKDPAHIVVSIDGRTGWFGAIPRHARPFPRCSSSPPWPCFHTRCSTC